MFDVDTLRKDFPILSRQVHGQPLVYLDNAATTQKPRQVIDSLVHYYENYNANIHRGLHKLAEEATEAYEGSRAKVARFIKSPEGARSVIFTRNCTESLNLVANAWGRKFLNAGDEIVLSVLEHHSNLVPWQLIAKEKGAVLKFVDIDGEGRLRVDQLEQLIGPRTKIVSLVHASNVLGINPVRYAAELAHRQGAIMVVDGAQSVPNMPVDVGDLGCDFLAFSGHKMAGPTGIGVLWGKPDILEAMDPFLGGGEMISRVLLEESTWNELPWKYEAGTPNIADGIALGAAVDYLEGIGMENVRAHEKSLAAYAIDRMSALPEVTIYGPKDPEERVGVVAFNYGDIHPHDLSQVLDQRGIAIRAGHHCAQPLMRRLDCVATARASFYVYNTFAEIDKLVEALEGAGRFFDPDAAAAARMS
ncbi:MAG: SufS family cysteine desulfurase [Dehalococcoidia bacterium]|nr:SufS family cysteine desulfurase [Dehalococcoidia bacterium]